MTEQNVRLFIAINLPASLAERLNAEQRALGGRQAPVKWVDPAGAHLTLQFLGSVPTGRVDELLAALVGAAREAEPLTLRLQGLGAFPNVRRPRVIWAGLTGETAALAALQRRVVRETAALGFAAEQRPFKAHITLGRVREGADPSAIERVGRALAGRAFAPAEPWQVDAVALMRSELHPSGARYSLVGQALLQADASATGA